MVLADSARAFADSGLRNTGVEQCCHPPSTLLSRMHLVWVMKKQVLLQLEMHRFCGRDGVWHTKQHYWILNCCMCSNANKTRLIIALVFSWHCIGEAVLTNVWKARTWNLQESWNYVFHTCKKWRITSLYWLMIITTLIQRFSQDIHWSLERKADIVCAKVSWVMTVSAVEITRSLCYWHFFTYQKVKQCLSFSSWNRVSASTREGGLGSSVALCY